MADENPKGDQDKKQSPTKQSTSPAVQPNQPSQPRPKDTSAGGTPKTAQPGGSTKQPARQPVRQQGKPAGDQSARGDATRPPRPPAQAPQPASLAKPGSTPNGGDAQRRPAETRPGNPAVTHHSVLRPPTTIEGGVRRASITAMQATASPAAIPSTSVYSIPMRPTRSPAAAAEFWVQPVAVAPGAAVDAGAVPVPAPHPGRRETTRPPGAISDAPAAAAISSVSAAAAISSAGPSRARAASPAGHPAVTAATAIPSTVNRPRGLRPGEEALALGPKASGTASRTAAAAAPVTEITIPASLTVRELAEKMHRSAIEVIKTLMNYGMMIPITAPIDFDTAQLIGEELGVTVKSEKAPEPVLAELPAEAPKTLRQQIMASEKESTLVLRPPIVTVLGHVDHGKTTLLDAIRETCVVDGEAGGITQHIGAYQVERDGRKITFLDTPGHEAFTAMRARGAQVTDIAVLVVAADDGVMPQTKEAISHVKAAQVAMVVALNKIDKPNANPDRVKQELADNGVLIEEYGGDVVCVPVSAKMRRGIGDLLENILLVADIDPLKANPTGDCMGTVVESRLDKNRGPMATLLVQNGTLHIGDSIVTGETTARIRAMYDDKGEPITEAPPSTPVAILGLAEVPVAGDTFQVVTDDRTARGIASERVETRRAATVTPGAAPRTLESFFAAAEAGQVKELNLILKADVQGSIEPIVNSIEKLGDEKLHVKLLHQATGNITESDVMLAIASKAIILGFSVVVDAAAQRMAEAEGVDIRIYNIIYKLIEDIEKALKGMLEPVYKEIITGHAEIRQVFRVTKVGKVAGCYVTDGELTRNTMARIKRGEVVLREDKIVSLKRFQEDAPEVKTGFECGLNFGNFNEFETGDIIEAYKKERVS